MEPEIFYYDYFFIIIISFAVYWMLTVYQWLG